MAIMIGGHKYYSQLSTQRLSS